MMAAKNMQEKWCRDASYMEPRDAMTTKTELYDFLTEPNIFIISNHKSKT